MIRKRFKATAKALRSLDSPAQIKELLSKIKILNPNPRKK